eukprot:Rhum_TRINITY_DN11708_c1_g1::Rhum_TRINITY_DN11708_c1_g1_i1::g.46360::m.46360
MLRRSLPAACSAAAAAAAGRRTGGAHRRSGGGRGGGGGSRGSGRGVAPVSGLGRQSHAQPSSPAQASPRRPSPTLCLEDSASSPVGIRRRAEAGSGDVREKFSGPSEAVPREVLDVRTHDEGLHVLRTRWKKHGGGDPYARLLQDFYNLLEKGVLGDRAVLYALEELGSKRVRQVRKLVQVVPTELLTQPVLAQVLVLESQVKGGDEQQFSATLELYRKQGFRKTLPVYNASLGYYRRCGDSVAFRRTLREMVSQKVAFDAAAFGHVLAASPPREVGGVLKEMRVQGVAIGEDAVRAVMEACEAAAGDDDGAGREEALRVARSLYEAWGEQSALFGPEARAALLRVFAACRSYDEAIALYRDSVRSPVHDMTSVVLALLFACEKACNDVAAERQSRYVDVADSAFRRGRNKGSGDPRLFSALFNVFKAAGYEQDMRNLIEEATRVWRKGKVVAGLQRKYALYLRHKGVEEDTEMP